MRLIDLSERTVIDAIEAFYQECNRYVSAIARLVGNQTYSLPRHARQVGASQFPYFYAVDLYDLFAFARGRKAMSPSYVEKKCEEVLAIRNTAVCGEMVAVDWVEFSRTPLGLCILACGARISLRQEEGTLSVPQVRLLSDWTDKKLAMSGLVPIEEGDDPQFRAADVRAVFEEEGVRI